MVVWGLSEKERYTEPDSLELLPDLEEGVLFGDTLIVDSFEAFSCAIDDWWGNFISDMCL